MVNDVTNARHMTHRLAFKSRSEGRRTWNMTVEMGGIILNTYLHNPLHLEVPPQHIEQTLVYNVMEDILTQREKRH